MQEHADCFALPPGKCLLLNHSQRFTFDLWGGLNRMEAVLGHQGNCLWRRGPIKAGNRKRRLHPVSGQAGSR